MDQPSWWNRWRIRWGTATDRTRKPIALQLVPLQERFGPSSLSGGEAFAHATVGTMVVSERPTATPLLHTPLPDVSSLPTPNVVADAVVETAPSRGLTSLVGAELPAVSLFSFTTTPLAPNTPEPTQTPATTAKNSPVPVLVAPPSGNAVVASGLNLTPAPTPTLTKSTPVADTVPEISEPLPAPDVELPVTSDEPPVVEELPWIDEAPVIEELPWIDEPLIVDVVPADESSLEAQIGDAPLEPMLPPASITAEPQSRLESTAEEASPMRVRVTTVTPQEAPQANPSGEQFRVSRTGADSSPLTVTYQLSAFQGATVVTQQGTAVIPAGGQHVFVAASGHGLAGRAEVVTLTVQAEGATPRTPTTATLFQTPRERVSDTALFAAFRHGPSQVAFQHLVARHQASVTRTAMHFVGQSADAEDISQLVFLALARQEMTIQTSLHYWLQKVTRNASIAFLRAKARRLRHEMEAAKPTETPSLDDAHTLQDQLEVALTHLPAHLQEAVRLRYLEGWTQQEAAAIVGCPRGTLSQRASQGLQTLRDLMHPEQREAS